MAGFRFYSRLTAFFVMIFVSQGFLSSQTSLLDDPALLSARISEYVEDKKDGLASVAVGVFKGSETVYEGYFGHADIDAGLRADSQTVYEWGSISKLFVWVSAMQLFEEGKINFDTDIREYLPAGFLKDFSFDDKITMIHLMNHTGGFQECVYQNENAKESDIKSLEQTLRFLQPKQTYRPGETTAYSNWSTSLAAYIVERISGMDYADYVHKKILEPLGMNHTAVSATHSDNQWAKENRELLKTYVINSEGRKDYGTNVSYVEVYPAGAVISPLPDMMIFAKALATPDSKLFKSAETHREFLSATSYFGDSGIPKNCHGMWTAAYSKLLVGHGGNTNGCTAELLFDPVDEEGIVVMANECGESVFCYGLPELVFGHADFSFLESDLKSDIPSVESDRSDDISGFYTMSRSFKKGFLKFAQYTFFFPVFRTENPDVFKVGFQGSLTYKGSNRYILDNGNGMTVLMCLSHNKKGRPMLEMMSCDYVRDPFFVPIALIIVLMFLFALVCAVILIVKLVRLIIRRVKKQPLALTKKKVLSVVSLVAQDMIVIILVKMLFSETTVLVKPFAIFSAILAGILCLFSIVNGLYLIWKKRVFYAFISCYAAFFIIFFQFYNFWSC